MVLHRVLTVFCQQCCTDMLILFSELQFLAVWRNSARSADETNGGGIVFRIVLSRKRCGTLAELGFSETEEPTYVPMFHFSFSFPFPF